jgi:tRNA pseudouridine65 synthase
MRRPASVRRSPAAIQDARPGEVADAEAVKSRMRADSLPRGRSKNSAPSWPALSSIVASQDAMSAAGAELMDDDALPVLWRDEVLVAVHKPSGLLVHRTEIDRHERRFAVQMLRDQIGQTVYPVHRLDKGTSGVLLFALEPRVARRVAESFAAGDVRKQYLAVVRGWPAEHGVIEHPLAPVADDRAAQTSPLARPASTHYTRRATAELPYRVDRYATSRYALLELEPATGRRHQLRRHLAHISHPIIGDSTYGKARHNRLFAELFGSRRLLLASVALAFEHPLTGRPISITAPPSTDFATILEQLGW